MANRDFTYCYGRDCILSSQCKRCLDGQRIMANVNDNDQYWWIDNCNPEQRDGYISVKAAH